MKSCVFSVLLASFSAASVAQQVDWKWLQQIRFSTPISVQTKDRKTGCRFEKVDADQLLCYANAQKTSGTNVSKFAFHRSDIRSVVVLTDYDDSKGFLTLMGAAGGGGAVDSAHQPDWFAGVKLGGPFSLDLQYDMLRGHSGFSIEGSPLIPILRFPRFNPDEDRNFVKMYAEPGIGRRFGSGPFGGYSSAKVLFLFLSDSWPSRPYPYIEVQRRFPFSSPMDGDTRIAFGMMFALCAHCGVD